MEGFTVALALVDALPVLFFGGSMAILAARFGSPLFAVGAGLCIVAGLCKVLWKLLLGLKKGNFAFLTKPFVPCMAGGFLLMLAAVAINWKRISLAALWADISSLPSAAFFALGLAAMAAMGVLAKKLDQKSAKSNWCEQIVNSVAQGAILLGVLFTQ